MEIGVWGECDAERREKFVVMTCEFGVFRAVPPASVEPGAVSGAAAMPVR